MNSETGVTQANSFGKFTLALNDLVPRRMWDSLATRYYNHLREFWYGKHDDQGWVHPDWVKLRASWADSLKFQLAAEVYSWYFNPKNTREACAKSDEFIVAYEKLLEAQNLKWEVTKNDKPHGFVYAFSDSKAVAKVQKKPKDIVYVEHVPRGNGCKAG